jgi:GNAT superfamily N-acetyltransferase
MVDLLRTDSTQEDFVRLVSLLDADLAIRDGDDHPFYAQYNKLDSIKYVVVAYKNGKAAGCGAFKEFAPGIAEVKRMFTVPDFRSQGIASLVLSELEKWARELGYVKCILETGIKQPEAIALYNRSGYSLMDNFGQYTGVANSLCFEKIL